MKKLLYLIVCNVFTVFTYAQHQFYVSGEFPDTSLHGTYITISKISLPFGEEFHPLMDSVLVVGKSFNYEGENPDSPFLARILYDGKKEALVKATLFIVEPGTITIKITDWDYRGHVSGTRINDDYYNYIIEPGNVVNRIRRPWKIKYDEGYRNRTWTEDDEREYTEKALSNPESHLQLKKSIEFMEKYARYPEVIRSLLFPFLRNDQTEPLIKHILDGMPESDRDTLLVRQAQFIQWRDEVRTNRERDSVERFTPIEVIPEYLQIGKIFSDFVGKTPDGEVLKLSEILPGKKLILLDFWASWCGPCIREMPVIAGLHEKYKEEGLAVIGISSDASETNWKQAIGQYNMEWLQLISPDGKDRIGELYSIKTIPYTVIIDGDGTILARKLRGEKLVTKIDDLMAK